MITSPEIWDILLKKMPRECWVSLQQIYKIVERYGSLDREDFYPKAPGSSIPKWKRNVSNVLQNRKDNGAIRWNGKAEYWLR